MILKYWATAVVFPRFDNRFDEVYQLVESVALLKEERDDCLLTVELLRTIFSAHGVIKTVANRWNPYHV